MKSLFIKESFPPLIVYKNLKSLIKNRNLEIVSTNYIAGTKNKSLSATEKLQEKKWLSDDEFKKIIQFNEHIIIEATDSDTKERRYPKSIHENCHKLSTKTFIVIINKLAAQIKSMDLQKIIFKLPEVKSTTRKFNIDVLILVEDYLTIHAIKKIETFKFSGDEKSGSLRINHAIFSLLADDIFSRELIWPHKIVSIAETEKILDQLKRKKGKLAQQKIYDPISFMLGCEVGDLIEIERFSENAGIELTYRVVIQ